MLTKNIIIQEEDIMSTNAAKSNDADAEVLYKPVSIDGVNYFDYSVGLSLIGDIDVKFDVLTVSEPNAFSLLNNAETIEGDLPQLTNIHDSMLQKKFLFMLSYANSYPHNQFSLGHYVMSTAADLDTEDLIVISPNTESKYMHLRDFKRVRFSNVNLTHIKITTTVINNKIGALILIGRFHAVKNLLKTKWVKKEAQFYGL